MATSKKKKNKVIIITIMGYIYNYYISVIFYITDENNSNSYNGIVFSNGA